MEEIENKVAQELSIQTTGLLTASKADLSHKVTHAVQLVKEGFIDTQDAYLFAKKFEAMGKDLVAQLKPLADDVTIQKGGIERYHCLITQGEQGVKWDYSGCGDPEWYELNEQAKDIKEKKDAREKFLQGITKKTTIVDDDFVTHEINPPVKSGSLGLTVKLK